MTLCHYRGLSKPSGTLVSYGKHFALIHRDESLRKLKSIYAEHIGISIYKEGHKTFVAFNFKTIQTTMLLVFGVGDHACFQRRNTNNYNITRVQEMDVGNAVFTTALKDSKIDSIEAESIYDTMCRMEQDDKIFHPMYKDYWVEDEDLWNSTKEFLKSKIA